jgi:pimeloyl-ACP methyl ester carboxylesterase
VTLYIDAVGPINRSATAKTIVFLHGGGVSGWMWKPQVDVLSSVYRCLIVDLPEHGKSRDEQPFTMEDSASRIAGIIRSHVRDGKAHVVGLSLGA